MSDNKSNWPMALQEMLSDILVWTLLMAALLAWTVGVCNVNIGPVSKQPDKQPPPKAETQQ